MQRQDSGLTVFEAILARRSVRSYRAAKLDRKTILSLLEAAVRAPTAVRAEPWAFVVIQDRQMLQRLSQRAKPLYDEEMRRTGVARSGRAEEVFASPDFNIFYDAGTLIVICAQASGPLATADCWLAAENLMLAATAMELGTCVIGSALPALNTAQIKAELGIPVDCSAVAPIIVGHARGDTPVTPRKEPLVLAWHRGTVPA